MFSRRSYRVALLALIAVQLASCSDQDASGVDAHYGSTTQAVSGVNDAPVLDNTKSPTLVPMVQTSAAPSGVVGSPVSTIVDYASPAGQVDNVTDVDVSESEASALGIAITAADTTNGNWFFSTNNGTTWTALGAVSNTSARLLAADANTRLYFQANFGFAGTATITFRAWDGTSGTAGNLADTSTNGDPTAFSTATDTASLTVVAPIAFRSASINGTAGTSSTTLAITKPTGTAQGDLLVVGITISSATATIATPAGWLAIVNTTGSGERLGVYYKAAGAAEPASYTFTFNASVDAAGGMAAYTGVDTSNPIEVVASTATPSSLTHAAPSVTPFVGNTMLLTWHAYASAGTWTPPTGMTEAIDAKSETGTGAVGFSIEGNYQTLSTAAATGTRTATASNNADTGITAALALKPKNNAPVLDHTKSPALAPVNEDAPLPSGAVGTLVSSLIDYNLPAGQVDNLIDIDGGLLFGIAITAVDPSLTCSYSLDAGTTWTPIPAVTNTSALPLAADATTRIYCAGAANANGTVASALTFRAWDMSLGTAGTLDDASQNGGTNPYSTATDTISLTINPVDDAPTATNMSASETYTEDTPLDLIDIVVSDIDSTTVTVTLTLSNPSAGALSTGTSNAVTSTYVAGTGVWTASGAIADVNTLLAGVVFTPATNFNASFTIATTVTDGTLAGTPGSKAVTGTPANDPPTATNLSAAEAYTEDMPLNLIDIVAADVDSTTLTATLTLSNIAAGSLTTATSGTTTSTYSAATGVWTATGPTAEINALLAGVSYVPAANFNSVFSLGTDISDGTASVSGSKAFIGTPVNDAPVLDASKSPALAPVAEDSAIPPTGAVGTLVSSLVDTAGALANVTDPDSGAQLGIAITAADTANLTIYYSLDDGATWSALGAVAANNARLLAADADNRIYVAAGPNVNGTFPTAITFRAWDTTSGTDGALADTTSNGTTTAFSTATDTASVVVTNVNDAPTATNLSAAEAYTEDTALDLIDIVVSDIDSPNVTATLTLSNTSAGTLSTGTSGSVTSTFSAGVWTASGPIANVNVLLASVTYNPAANFNASFTITTSVSDGVAPAITGSKAMTGTAVNDAPTATNLSASETYTEDTPLDLTNIVVSDVDSANITVTLTLSNAAVGTLNTGTSGSVTSTFSNGVWTASGALANVNTLLAALTFTPAANSSVSFTMATSVSDGVAPAITGTKSFSGVAVNDPPSATNLSVNETYTENVNLDLVDIVVSDPDSVSVTATLTLSNPAAGALTTGTSGSSTSMYNAGTGVWTVSGLIFNVNTQLANVQFVPATNFNGTFTIATSVSDGGTPVTGSKTMNGIAVNQPPTATNLSAAETYIEDTAKNLTDIVVTDVDSAAVTATLTLSTTTAGSLTTGTSGSTTSSYNAGTGVWSASGPITDVNALLASATFVPAQDFNANFTIATSVTDGASAAVTGTKNMTGTPVNDPPTATNLNAPETYTEDTPQNLVDIVISDVDGGNTTATLTLSTIAAGTLTTATSGTVTSTFSNGVWSASGPIANVNTLLAGVTFNPAMNFNGNFAILTNVSDGVAAALTGSKSVTGTAVNDPPVAVDDTGTVPEGASVTINLKANDTDVDDGLDPGSITIVAQGAHGMTTANADGTATYKHDDTDTTNDSFTYTIKDNSGAVSNVATVAITITPVADDKDGDGVTDDIDNCPDVANTSQLDTDMDGIGDKCDPTPGGTDSGCGCSGGKNAVGGWPILFAVGLLFRRRRRR